MPGCCTGRPEAAAFFGSKAVAASNGTFACSGSEPEQIGLETFSVEEIALCELVEDLVDGVGNFCFVVHVADGGDLEGGAAERFDVDA